MNAARAATVALIAFSGVTIPASGAAHADEPLLCGLLTPCDEDTGDGDSGDDALPAPIDIDLDLDLDLGVDLDLDAAGDDLDTDVTGDVDTDVDAALFPDDGTLLDASADASRTSATATVLDHTVDAAAAAVVDTDAHVGSDGAIVTASGAADAQVDANAAGYRLLTADAADRLCGVQIVIAASSTVDCRQGASAGGSSGTDGAGAGLIAVAESLDVCGADVVIAGAASSDCTGRAPAGSQNAGSSWTLADTTVTGTACGLSVAVVGASSTSCGGTTQEVPVPGAGPTGPGTGTPGTGTSTDVGNSSGSGAGSSPAAQPAQSAGESDDAASGGSLPLTGASLMLILMIAGAVLAAGLVAVRTSRVRIGHQS